MKRSWLLYGAMLATAAMFAGACEDDLSIPGARRDGGGVGGDSSAPAVCTLKACDLIITELLSAPKSGGFEWFEIRNNTDRSISLAGLKILQWHKDAAKPNVITIGESNAPTLAKDEHIAVIKPSTKDGGSGGPTARHVNFPRLSLVNSPDKTTGATIRLACGATTIAEVVYGKTGGLAAPKSGMSKQLDGKLLGAGAITCDKLADAKNWCDVDAKTTAYDTAGNKGTLAAANTDCAGTTIPPTKGKCDDNGTSRDVVVPKATEISITEIFGNPSGGDDYKEWVELAIDADFDLNELKFSHTNGNSTRAYTVTSKTCVAVKKGSYVLLGSSKEKTDKSAATYNGGVDVTYIVLDAAGKVVKQFVYNGPSSGKTEATFTVKDGKDVELATAKHGTLSSGVSHCYDATAKKWDKSTTTGQFDGTGTPGKAECKHK